MGALVLFLLFTNFCLPILCVWFTIKYVFKLRQKQNDQFIVDLIDALRKENLSKPD